MAAESDPSENFAGDDDLRLGPLKTGEALWNTWGIVRNHVIVSLLALGGYVLLMYGRFPLANYVYDLVMPDFSAIKNSPQADFNSFRIYFFLASTSWQLIRTFLAITAHCLLVVIFFYVYPEKELNLGNVWNRIKERYLQIAGGIVLYTILLECIHVVTQFLLSYGIGVGGTGWMFVTAGGILSVYICMAILSVLLITAMFLYFPVLVFEERNILRSVTRSFRLVYPVFIRTFLIMAIAGGVVVGTGYIIFSSDSGRVAESMTVYRSWYYILGNSFLYFFVGLLVVVTYFDAKIRDEGFDYRRIAALFE